MKTNNNLKPKRQATSTSEMVQLTQKPGSNLWTWEVNGKQVRNHFLSGFWYCEDGEHVFWCWQDLEKHTLSKIKAVEILVDPDGRKYVEVKRKGQQPWKQYLDEAVCTCFHGKPKPGQIVSHKGGNISNCEADNLEWIYPIHHPA